MNVRAGIAVLLGAVILTGSGIMYAELVHNRRSAETTASESPPAANRPLRTQSLSLPKLGVFDPPVVTAGQARLAPGAPVVGVVVDGVARAYAIALLQQPGFEIINDHVNGMQLAVTFCPFSESVRILSAYDGGSFLVARADDSPGTRLNLFVMASGAQPATYAQDSGELPLLDWQHSLTTWGEWRREHGDTTVLDMDRSSRELPESLAGEFSGDLGGAAREPVL
jgi:hypothetical protein